MKYEDYKELGSEGAVKVSFDMVVCVGNTLTTYVDLIIMSIYEVGDIFET